LSEFTKCCPFNIDPTNNALAAVEGLGVGALEGLYRHA